MPIRSAGSMRVEAARKVAAFTPAHRDEWASTPEQVDALHTLDDERDRPMMAIVAAQR